MPLTIGAAAAAAAILSFPFLLRKTRATLLHIDLKGKLVVITGGSRGLGLALAEEFARRGARLALIARDGAELERAADTLRRSVHGIRDVAVFACDITSETAVQQTFATIASQLGQVDVLVNNAGVIVVGPAENQPTENYRQAMDVNFYGMLHCTLATLPAMLARREGSIVNITSVGGKVPVPHLLPYSASKFAAVGFSEGLHAELRAKGVRVTTVCPGLMRNGSFLNAEFTGNAQNEYRLFSLGASLPLFTISVARAASEIIDAVTAGQGELTITPQAVVAARLHGIAPGFISSLLSLVSGFLPAPSLSGMESTPVPGHTVRQRELRPLTKLGNRAADRYNQHGRRSA